MQSFLDGLFGPRKPVSAQSPRVKESQDYLKANPTLKPKLDAALNACLEAQGRAWPEEFDPIVYIEGALRVTPCLGSNLSLLGAEEMRLASLLVSIGQGHIFDGWPPAGKRDEEKRALFAQLATLEASYPGGMRAYYNNAKKLLADAKEGKNPLEGVPRDPCNGRAARRRIAAALRLTGSSARARAARAVVAARAGWTPEVPTGQRVSAGSEQFLALEKVGMDVVGQTGFVLVAGGLGERLGYNGIKIALPVDSISGKSFMQWYAEFILAYQSRACKAGASIPLAIMTSDDTHAHTQEFLEAHDFFGLRRSQVTLMKQEKVPALVDNDARFARAAGSLLLETKPHGHGDVHHLLLTSGTAAAWAKAGLKYVAFFQDTNALAFRAMACLLGVSVKSKLEYNSLTVPRTPGEAVGGIVRLRHADGSAMTVNVEYNQLDPLLRATVSPEGDVADASGHSPYPGNINVLALELAPYLKVLQATGGQMAEFVNPKYKDKEKTAFTKPTRIECMMQDYPRLLGPQARVGFTQLDRWICFSPVKNNAVDAAKKAAASSPPESASTGEADMYGACAKMLRQAGGPRSARAPLPRADARALLAGAGARLTVCRLSAAPLPPPFFLPRPLPLPRPHLRRACARRDECGVGRAGRAARHPRRPLAADPPGARLRDELGRAAQEGGQGRQRERALLAAGRRRRQTLQPAARWRPRHTAGRGHERQGGRAQGEQRGLEPADAAAG